MALITQKIMDLKKKEKPVMDVWEMGYNAAIEEVLCLVNMYLTDNECPRCGGRMTADCKCMNPKCQERFKNEY